MDHRQTTTLTRPVIMVWVSAAPGFLYKTQPGAVVLETDQALRHKTCPWSAKLPSNNRLDSLFY